MAAELDIGFVGTAGANWSTTDWSNGVRNTGGGATIATGGVTGQLTQTATGYKSVRQYAKAAAASRSDQTLYGEVLISSLNEHYIDIGIRGALETSNYYFTGYGMTISPAAGTFSTLAGYGTGTYLDVDTPFTFVAGHWLAFQVFAIGQNFGAMLWDLTRGDAKPSSYVTPGTDTDVTPITGVPNLALHSGQSVTATPQFRNLRLFDGAGVQVQPSNMLFGF